MAYLNGNKVFLYGERTVDANLITKTITENGTYNANDDNADGYSSVVVNVQPQEQQGEYYARVVDYDGTVIAMKWLNNGDEFTMPSPPTHERLTFEGWSSSQQIVDNKITISGDNFIAGAMYYTKSGKNEFDIELNITTGLTVQCYAENGSTIDWEDGNVDTATSNGFISHTYESYGNYTIKYSGNFSGNIKNFNQSSSNYNLYVKRIFLKQNVSIYTSGEQIFGYLHNLTEIAMSNCLISNTFVYHCSNLKCMIIPPINTNLKEGTIGYTSCETFVIPYTITSCGYYPCRDNPKLKYVIAPNVPSLIDSFCINCVSLTTIKLKNNTTTSGNYAFKDCQNLTTAKMTAVTTLSMQTFQNCYSLQEIDLPSTVTTIGQNCFYNCYRLNKITFSSSNLTISGGAFSNVTNATFDFLQCTAVPTLSNSNAFNGTYGKILVPSSLYDTWKAASNWVTYASRIIPVDNT